MVYSVVAPVPASSLFLRQDPAGSHPGCQAALVPGVCLKSEKSSSYFFGSVEIPAVLAILPSDEGDLTLSSALGALEAVVVAGLHGTPEESATRRTNLIHISWKRGKNVKSEMKSFFFRAFKNVCCLFPILTMCIVCGIHPSQSCILQQT